MMTLVRKVVAACSGILLATGVSSAANAVVVTAGVEAFVDGTSILNDRYPRPSERRS